VRRPAAVCGLWIGALAFATGAAEPPPLPASPLSIGVAPFEQVTPADEPLPQLSSLLARHLANLGVQRVVGPEQLGAVAVAEPDAATVRSWASDADVAAIVVGRTTRVGSQLSVDVRLRSGATGQVSQTYVAEIAHPDRLEGSVEELAARIVDGAGALVAVTSPPPSPPASAQRGESGTRIGLGSFDADAPLTIRSDSLDAFQEEGMRRLVFSENVRATQADLTITSDRLEALYRENGSQPERLVAEGRVVVARRGREARCDRATYERSDRRLTCRGNAELREGDDRVTGALIEFDMDADRVVVSGGAAVVIHPNGAEEGAGAEGDSP
jgi:lipopolysaccharide export system protein LptA